MAKAKVTPRATKTRQLVKAAKSFGTAPLTDVEAKDVDAAAGVVTGYTGRQYVTLGSVPPAPSALDTQVGGGHYKGKAIQPVQYIHANGLGFLEGCIVKRITRWRDAKGLEDLQKIKHEVDLLIELEGLV